ncbi:MAG: DUF1236 domain-containing protein [Hyphomicrobiaceae bacterium]
MRRQLRTAAVFALPALIASAPAIAQTTADAQAQTRRAEQLKLVPRLTGSDRQRAIDYFRDSRIEQLSHIDFSVTVGAPVPRNISLYELPSAIVSLAPSYRGFRYARSREKIYVIDPTTFIVVDVMTLTGGATASLELSDAEIAAVASTLRSVPEDTSAPWRLGLGAELPATIALHDFPDELVRRLPMLKGYRYARTGGELVIADPSDRNVVLIIPD